MYHIKSDYVCSKFRAPAIRGFNTPRHSPQEACKRSMCFLGFRAFPYMYHISMLIFGKLKLSCDVIVVSHLFSSGDCI